MRSALLVGACALVAASASATQDAPFLFSGEVQVGQETTEAFGLHLYAGHVQFLDLPAGVRLEVAAPREDGDEAMALIRLLQADGHNYRILHEAQTFGSSDFERSFTYRVCGDEVTFFKPAPTVTPRCSE